MNMSTNDASVHAAIYRTSYDIKRLIMRNPLLKCKRGTEGSRRSPCVLFALDELFMSVKRSAGVSYSR